MKPTTTVVSLIENGVLFPTKALDLLLDTRSDRYLAVPHSITFVKGAVRNILFFGVEIPWMVITSPIIGVTDAIVRKTRNTI